MQTLPNEMLNEILNWLPLRERIMSRLVCKIFRDMTPKFDVQDLNSIKENLFELFAYIGLSHIPTNIPFYLPQSFKFVIRDETRFRTYIKIDLGRSTPHTMNTLGNPNTQLVARQIILDTNYEFTEMDDLDGIACHEGFNKLFSNVKSLLKISMKEYQSLIFNDTHELNCRWMFQSLLLRTSIITNHTLEQLKFYLTAYDYHCAEQNWNSKFKIITQYLEPLYKHCNRKEELTLLLWLYLFE